MTIWTTCTYKFTSHQRKYTHCYCAEHWRAVGCMNLTVAESSFFLFCFFYLSLSHSLSLSLFFLSFFKVDSPPHVCLPDLACSWVSQQAPQHQKNRRGRMVCSITSLFHHTRGRSQCSHTWYWLILCTWRVRPDPVIDLMRRLWAASPSDRWVECPCVQLRATKSSTK